ncbi:MAG: hypothetical protein IPL83_16520 [Bdellovibrionales bacterium]|nr:hypothetical protein [Bdellovibrionales bacterium]
MNRAVQLGGRFFILAAAVVILSACDNTIMGHIGLGSGIEVNPVLNDFSGQGSDFYVPSSSHSMSWSLAHGNAESYEVRLFNARNCGGTPQQVSLTNASQFILSGLLDSEVYSVQVIALKGTLASPPICSTNLVVDLQKPQLTITLPSAPVTQGGTQFEFSWTSSDQGVSGLHPAIPFKVELFTGSGCSGVAQNIIQQIATTYSWTGLIDGVYSLRLTAFDLAGNASTPQCTSSVTIGNNLATLSLSEASSSVGYTRNLLITAAIGNDTAASKWCLSESQTTVPANGSATCTGGEGPSNNWYLVRPTTLSLGGSDGPKTVYVWLADVGDAVGSTGVTQSIILDRVEPAGTCSGISAEISSTWVAATAGCTDATSGCRTTECRLDGGAWSGSCEFSGLSESAHNIQVRGTDNAGNIQTSGYGTCTFTIDTIPPTATLLSTPSDPSSDTILNVTVAGAGVTHYRSKVGIGIDCNSPSGYSVETAIATPITDSVGMVGNYNLCVVGRDLAGNYQAYPGTQYSWSRVSNLPPVITAPANLVFPMDGTNEPVIAQTSLSLVATAIDPESNNPIVWPTCIYQTMGLHPSDPNYAGPGTNCGSLASYTLTNGVYLTGGTASFSNGILSWIPTVTQRGTYQFTVTAQDSLGNSSNESFYISVRDRFSSSQFVYGLDPLFSIDSTPLTGLALVPRLDGTANDDLRDWLDLKSGAVVSLANMSASPWKGDGTPASSYALGFNGSTNYLNLGSVMNSFTKLRFSTWVRPSSAASSTILSNSSASKGFEIRQGSSIEAGKMVLFFGDSGTIKTYREEVMSDSPTGYWKLDEPESTSASTTAIKEISGANYCGGNPCHLELPPDTSHPDLGQPTMKVLFGSAVWFDGGDDGGSDVLGGYGYGVKYSYSDCSGADEAFTLEAWINLASDYSSDGAIMASHNNGNVTRGYVFGVNAAKKLYMRLFEMESDSKRIGRLYNTALVVGTWHHVVMTYSGSETNAGIQLYLNGVRVDDTNDSAGVYTGNRYCVDFTIGRQLGGANLGFKGFIDEPAVYTGELNLNRILAHYNAATSNSYLISKNDLSTSYWNQIVTLFDGTIVSFFLNGQLEGSVTPPGGWDPNGASAVHLGNSNLNTSFWGGDLGGFKLFGSSDGSSAGSSQVVGADFQLEANRYRSIPIENIKTSNLLLHLDAANALQALSSYAADTGCSSNATWSPVQGSMSGVLWFFDSCGTYGWKGTGTSVNPYRLIFDGDDSGVWLDDSDTFSFTDGAGNDQPFSLEIWIRLVNSANTILVTMDDSNYPAAEYYLYLDSNKYTALDLVDSDASAVRGRRGSTQLSTNTWYQLVATYSGSETETGIKLYVNGTEQSYVSTSNANPYDGMNKLGSVLKLGREFSTNWTLSGDMSIVRVYNAVLTPTEIVQNCQAQQNRFTGLTCAVP